MVEILLPSLFYGERNAISYRLDSVCVEAVTTGDWIIPVGKFDRLDPIKTIERITLRKLELFECFMFGDFMGSLLKASYLGTHPGWHQTYLDMMNKLPMDEFWAACVWLSQAARPALENPPDSKAAMHGLKTIWNNWSRINFAITSRKVQMSELADYNIFYFLRYFGIPDERCKAFLELDMNAKYDMITPLLDR